MDLVGNGHIGGGNGIHTSPNVGRSIVELRSANKLLVLLEEGFCPICLLALDGGR